jgi:hypothetical protein
VLGARQAAKDAGAPRPNDVTAHLILASRTLFRTIYPTVVYSVYLLEFDRNLLGFSGLVSERVVGSKLWWPQTSSQAVVVIIKKYFTAEAGSGLVQGCVGES